MINYNRIAFTALFIFSIYKAGQCQKTELVYLNKDDHNANFYLSILPNKLPLTGYLVLVPGYGETQQEVLEQTDLPMRLAEHGIMTIIPTFKTTVFAFGIDDKTQESFREIVNDLNQRYKLDGLEFFVGGFSIGGSCAMRFAELAQENNYKYKPAAVFTIDAPLDLERLYNSYKRSVRLSVNTKPSEEAVFMIDRIEKEMGGTPQQAIENYYAHSAYAMTDTQQRAIRNLLATPIRCYTEPDVHWWLKERGADYSNINALDASAVVNELNRLGNAKAELITTKNKGYRKPDNKRHPHSWSIVDVEDLAKWLLSVK